MKILFFSDDFPPNNLGGAGSVAFTLATTIQKTGHVVEVISTTQNKDSIGKAVFEGLNVHKIYSNYHRRWRAYLSLFNPQVVKKVSEIVIKFKPDVVFAHNVHQHLSYQCLKIAKKSGAKVFLTAHDAMLFHYGKIAIPKEATCENFTDYCKVSALRQMREYKKRYNPLRNLIIKRYLAKYVNKVIAVSESLRKILVLNGIKNVKVIYNSIDVGAYNINYELVDAFKKEKGLENKKVVLFGGRISDDKGYKQLMSALKLVADHFPDLLLVVAGSAGKDIKDNVSVKFLGWLSGKDMKLALAASDIVVFPSICFETFGMVVLEAMALKKPVIGTCFGGSSEIIINNETGYIVNPYNTEALASRILSLLNDRQKAEEWGQKGYNRAREHFNSGKQALNYLELCYVK